MYHLLIDLAGGGILHQHHVLENQVQVKVQIPRQERRGAHAQDIDALRLQQQIHHPLEFLPVHLLDGGVDAVHVPLHHRADHVRPPGLLPGCPDPLHGGQTPADQLLQGLLHAGVAVIAHLGSKAHHGGLADLGHLAQPAGRHEGGLIIVFQDIVRHPLLALGKRIHAGANGM